MNMTLTQNRPRLQRRRESGLSLIELMVSITIGLILLAGLTTLIVRQSSARDELEKTSRQIENGRYAMSLLQNDIQLAGFYSEYSPPNSTTYTTPDPCLTTGNLGWATTPDVPVHIYGYTGAAASPSCVSNRLNGTAILVVRRTATAEVSAASAVEGTTYFQANACKDDVVPFVVAASAASFTLKQKDCTTALAPLRKYIVRIYYISSCDECGTDTIPTLKMVEFVDGAQTTVPLVEGIENMRFDYGLDNVGTVDGAADSYTEVPAATEWKDIVTVRINLLARNIDSTAGYVDNKAYDLGGASTVSPGGAYKRHAYSEIVRVTNISGRRENP